MKSIFLILLIIFTSHLGFTQDTLRFTRGEVKAVKVMEIGINEIKYVRFDNPTGPMYTVNKDDVQSIKFANGQIDVFEKKAEPTTQQNNQPIVQANTVSGSEKISIHGTKLSYFNKPMGEARLWKVINQYPNGQKKDILIKEYQNMKSYKKRQYAFGFVGLGVGVAAAYVGFIGTLFSEDATPIIGGFAVGITCGVTGAIISSINKSKRLKKKVEVAEIYNN